MCTAAQRAMRWRERTCDAVGDVDGAGAGQPGGQRHALQRWNAGLAALLTLSFLSLGVTVPAVCLGVACRHRGGGQHWWGRGWNGLGPQRLRAVLWTQQDAWRGGEKPNDFHRNRTSPCSHSATAPPHTGSYWFLPRLPFQLVSLRSSVMGELLIPRLWERRPELLQLVLEMDIRDLEGRMADGVSNLAGSFLERWWRTLIIASFSIIWAWRFFILYWRGEDEGEQRP